MLSLILWFSAIGCGLVAGLYFAFLGFIMQALGRIDLGASISAMNAINKAILGSHCSCLSSSARRSPALR